MLLSKTLELETFLPRLSDYILISIISTDKSINKMMEKKCSDCVFMAFTDLDCSSLQNVRQRVLSLHAFFSKYM